MKFIRKFGASKQFIKYIDYPSCINCIHFINLIP